MLTVQIDDYSALVKNELVMLMDALGLPQHCADVLALIVASTSSYTHESALTLGHLRTRYRQDSMLCMSGCAIAQTLVKRRQ